MINLSDDLNTIFTQVNNAGYKIYLVGGFIRDYFLGISTNDYDLASTMPLNQIENIIFGSKLIDLKGVIFLSAKFMLNNNIYEITNLRTEGPYKKPGYPSKVRKTNDIYEDLKRRDFTINSLAYSPFDGLIDPYQGLRDLENKTIRTIKNPFESYKEDPTRILRAYRFSFKLNFKIYQDDLKAIEEYKILLKKLSKKQLEKELNKFSEKEKLILIKKGII